MSLAPSSYLLFGPPGSGKGTQSSYMMKKGFHHISTGDLLRGAIEKKSALGRQVQEFMDQGQLVSDEIVISLVKEVLEKLSPEEPVVFDGFPRTVAQAEALGGLLEKQGRPLKRVFFLDVPDKVVVERLSGRRSCPRCGTVYHLTQAWTESGEERCDACQVDLVQRTDDTPEVVQGRLKVYHEKISPVREFYEQKGLVEKVDGTLSPSKIFDEICGFLC